MASNSPAAPATTISSENPVKLTGNAAAYERRAFGFTLRSDDGPAKIAGHAAVFNDLSEEMGGFFMSFREKIMPGAFDEALKRVRSGQDAVFALWNHNPDYIISSTNDGTLDLTTDERGLFSVMTPMDTQTIRDLVVTPIQQGKVNKMSFGFTVSDEHDEKRDDKIIRVIDKIGRLFDVSPVTYPAYPQTDVQARALLSGLHVNVEALSTPEQVAVRSFINSIARHLPTASAQEGRVVVDPAPLAGASASVRGRLLELQDRDFALALIERK